MTNTHPPSGWGFFLCAGEVWFSETDAVSSFSLDRVVYSRRPCEDNACAFPSDSELVREKHNLSKLAHQMHSLS